MTGASGQMWEDVMGYRVVVAGATGNVGREMLNILAEREFPADEIAVVASSRSQGDMVDFGETGKQLKVQNIDHFDPEGWDIALFAIGSEGSKLHAPRFAAAGCTVIDNASFYRMDPDVPLIVPEVNPEAIEGYRAKNIIANPNCSTAQLVVALKPLHDAARIKRVVVATYQSVSGAGKAGMDELFEQSRNIFVGDPATPSKFTKQIAFNVIPHIDDFLDDGSTKEEWKMVVETKKILGPKIKVHATCVRVPVFVGHSEAVNIEFEDEISAAQAKRILREAPGVMLIDKHEDGGYVTPIECVGEYATFISRVREDPTVDNGLSLWCVSDNLRKGAAFKRGADRRTARKAAPAEGGLSLHGSITTAEIDAEHHRLGYASGWRFMMCQQATMRSAKLLVVTLNPGGNGPHGTDWSYENGNAYCDEKWAGEPGTAKLQRQMQKLYEFLGVRKDEVFSANYVPFRSPTWHGLERKPEVLAFADKLWTWLRPQLSFEVAVCIGKDQPGRSIARLFDARHDITLKVGWGEVTADRYRLPDGRKLIALPHLSRFLIFDRPASRPYLQRIFEL